MARLMQVGERLHNHTIGLLEPLRAFRFCSAAPAPHAKPCHDSPSTFLDLDFLISELPATPITSAPYQSAATEQLGSERCEHLSQMTEMPNDGRVSIIGSPGRSHASAFSRLRRNKTARSPGFPALPITGIVSGNVQISCDLR